MLDYDLARIYGYETKNFNRQVKNNIVKFPEDFMFQLNESEINEILRCRNFTAKQTPRNLSSVNRKNSGLNYSFKAFYRYILLKQRFSLTLIESSLIDP